MLHRTLPLPVPTTSFRLLLTSTAMSSDQPAVNRRAVTASSATASASHDGGRDWHCQSFHPVAAAAVSQLLLPVIPTAHRWFQPYLSGCKQHVRHGSTKLSIHVPGLRRATGICVRSDSVCPLHCRPHPAGSLVFPAAAAQISEASLQTFLPSPDCLTVWLASLQWSLLFRPLYKSMFTYLLISPGGSTSRRPCPLLCF